MKKYEGQVDCIQCGFCCGYRRETAFGGCSYGREERVPNAVDVVETEEGYTVPTDADDVCIYLSRLDNGFARCSIHDKRPKMCRLFYCLKEQKARQLQTIVDELRG